MATVHDVDLEAGETHSRSSEGDGSSSVEIVGIAEKRGVSVSSSSECSVVEDVERKVHLEKRERDCRICHLSMDAGDQESGGPIDLGCSCKDDLAAAHKHCAEAWFKIKGNKICEICGSMACNVVGANEGEVTEQWNEEANGAAAGESNNNNNRRNFWQGHRFLNFLLACMVFAFVISWLFHFNVPS